MEELFHYMKTLRSQMNDVADQAAKISVEEHMLSTTIQSLQKDLDSVKNEIKLVKTETVDLTKAKKEICSQISEKILKIASLETDSYNLSQIKDAATAKLEKLEHLKSNIVLENTKLRQSVEEMKTKINNFKPELREMDNESLEEELQALLSDKAGESEYVESLRLQIMKLKDISQKVRCSCGVEYNVNLDSSVIENC